VQQSGGLANVVRGYIAYHLVRLYPLLTALLPRHRPRLEAAMAHELAHAGVLRAEEGR
jgi:cardiolipin synthase